MTRMTKFGFRSGENWFRGSELRLERFELWGFRAWRREVMEVTMAGS